MIDNPFGALKMPEKQTDNSLKDVFKKEESEEKEEENPAISPLVSKTPLNLKGINYVMEVEKIKSKGQILAEHGGLESNIGILHPYWKMKP